MVHLASGGQISSVEGLLRVFCRKRPVQTLLCWLWAQQKEEANTCMTRIVQYEVASLCSSLQWGGCGQQTRRKHGDHLAAAGLAVSLSDSSRCCSFLKTMACSKRSAQQRYCSAAVLVEPHLAGRVAWQPPAEHSLVVRGDTHSFIHVAHLLRMLCSPCSHLHASISHLALAHAGQDTFLAHFSHTAANMVRVLQTASPPQSGCLALVSRSLC